MSDLVRLVTCIMTIAITLGMIITPCALAQQRGRVIVLSVCLFVCLSAPTQDFEQNRLVYGLYLLRMSQKLKNNINLYLPHEREPRKADFSHFLGFVKTTF